MSVSALRLRRFVSLWTCVFACVCVCVCESVCKCVLHAFAFEYVRMFQVCLWFCVLRLCVFACVFCICVYLCVRD